MIPSHNQDVKPQENDRYKERFTTNVSFSDNRGNPKGIWKTINAMETKKLLPLTKSAWVDDICYISDQEKGRFSQQTLYQHWR